MPENCDRFKYLEDFLTFYTKNKKTTKERTEFLLRLEAEQPDMMGTSLLDQYLAYEEGRDFNTKNNGVKNDN